MKVLLKLLMHKSRIIENITDNSVTNAYIILLYLWENIHKTNLYFVKNKKKSNLHKVESYEYSTQTNICEMCIIKHIKKIC